MELGNKENTFNTTNFFNNIKKKFFNVEETKIKVLD